MGVGRVAGIQGVAARASGAGTAQASASRRQIRPASLPRPARLALSSLGLACWLSTLILYSETVTPFQRFPMLESFLGDFVVFTLGFAFVLCLIAGIAALRGHFVAPRILGIGGGCLHLVANTAFGIFALVGMGNLGLPWSEVAVVALSAMVAAGSVATGLCWGRVYKGADPRTALALIAGAGLTTALLGWALSALPPVPTLILFALASCAAALLPSVIGMLEPAGEAIVGEPAATGAAPRVSTRERLASFASVAAPALIGLTAFAFIMGTMRELIVETYVIHLATLAADSLILGAFALVRTRRSLVQAAYRSLIPALAVTLLAVTNITATLFGGLPIDMVMIQLLYTLAALLTLSTFGAIAHANEFASDLVFSVALGLFCLASVTGLKSAEFMTEEIVWVCITVITTVYAFSMALLAAIRSGRAASDRIEDAMEFEGPLGEEAGKSERATSVTAGRAPGLGVGRKLGHVSAATAPAVDIEDLIRQRCEKLTSDYGLTAREAEVLGILAQGHASGYISEALYISPNTVRTHVHNIYRKLGVSSREEVLTLARDSRG